MKIRLAGFVKDFKSRKEIENGKGWVEWRMLDLVDENNVNPEWFSLAACNQYYYDNVVLREGDGHGYYIQDKFNEKTLLRSVLEDFEELSFTDWDDFYTKMSKAFIYDEEV